VNCKLYVPLILFGNPEHYGHLDSATQLSAYPFSQLPPKWRALMDCNSAKTPLSAAPTLARAVTTGPRMAPRTIVGLGNQGIVFRRAAAGAGSTALFDLTGRRVRAPAAASAADAVYVANVTMRR
jgi:hypothetical protein